MALYHDSKEDKGYSGYIYGLKVIWYQMQWVALDADSRETLLTKPIQGHRDMETQSAI